MNPQYMPQQQFGAPPQGFNQNKPSPTQSGFQNVPLGPQKPGLHPNGPNQQQPLSGQQNHIPHSFLPPTLGHNQPPLSNMGPPGSHFGSGQPQGPSQQNLGNIQPNLPGQQSNLINPLQSSIASNVSGPPTSNAFSSNLGQQQPNAGGPPQTNIIGPPQTTVTGPLPPMSGQIPSSTQQSTTNNPPSNIPPISSGMNLSGPPPTMTQPLQQQVPPGQLPPGQLNKPLGPPTGSQPASQNLQNQFGAPPPMVKSNAPPKIMNGAGFGPQTTQKGFEQAPPVSQQNRPPLGPGYAPTGINGPSSQYPLGPKPPQNQQPNQYIQPPLGGTNQFVQQPVPGQFRQPPLPGQQNQFNQPPPPGQYNQFSSPGPNQLANQMQGMNLSGSRQYPGVPQKNQINGDGSPHMPPPPMGGQQGYLNGQQMRAGPQAPGYPSMPGQQPMASGPGAFSQPGYQQAQQNRRLDPDQMPSPIQVTQDDQRTRSGVFVTNQKGSVPPLVSTTFVVQDQGNASPRYVRSTMYNVPITQDLMKQTAVPFGLVISPMARTVGEEYPPPIVNFGDLGPVRCIRCKAYMCPFMQFIDSGRRFQCLFCKAATDVSNEYFQHLDHTGQRVDRYERPELVLGTYELTATPDYCRNNVLPKPPAIIFVIDVSYNNIKSGLVNLLCSQMKDIIQNLPVDQGQEKSNMKVGFITYNSSVHFYNIKGSLAAPQMLVVGDTQEMFMPLLDGFLCTPEESSQVIDSLMEQIPTMFGDTRETETVLLPAILAGLEALKASECAGKLLVFHSTLPIAEAPGKLKNRDDRKLLGTDKERTVLTPQTQAYNQLGQECVQVGCSVDLFLFNNAYIDVATISQVARLSGGEVYKYTYFQADLDGERLIKDIIHNISRPVAFDAIMRVRTSTGVRPTDFYGHFYMSNTTDMELAAIDCDKAIAVEIKHDDKLSEEEGVFIQIALLYTSCSGQRRLRIMNLSLKTCSQMSELYRSCDLDTLINFFGKQSVYKLLEHNPKAVKDGIVNRAAQILANYRKNCASPSSAGQLILPECMKLLPLYVNCLLKSDALSGGSDITLDDRSFVMQAVMTMDIPSSVVYFYPRLIPLHEVKSSDEPVEIPAPIRCTIEKISEQGVYILENGIHMFLWIGLNANPDFVQQVFGVNYPMQVDIDEIKIPELDNQLSASVRSVIDQIRLQRHRCMRLTIVRQREKLESVFKHFLVEDRGHDGSPSYVDFLCHMHKEIRTLLS